MVIAIQAESARLSHGCVIGRGRGCARLSIAATDGEAPELRCRVALPWAPSPLPDPAAGGGWEELPLLDAAGRAAAALQGRPVLVSPSWSGTYRALRDLLHQAGGDGWALTREPPTAMDLGKMRRLGGMLGVAVPAARDASSGLAAFADLVARERDWVTALAARAAPERALARLAERAPLVAVMEIDVAVLLPLGRPLPEAPHLLPCLSLGADGCSFDGAARFLREGGEAPELATLDMGDLPILARVAAPDEWDREVCEQALPPGLAARLMGLPRLAGERLEAALLAARRRLAAAPRNAPRDGARCARDGADARRRSAWLADLGRGGEGALGAGWVADDDLARVAAAHAKAHRAGDGGALRKVGAEVGRLYPEDAPALERAGREAADWLRALEEAAAMPAAAPAGASAGGAP